MRHASLLVKCLPLCTLCDSSGTTRVLDNQSPSPRKNIGVLEEPLSLEPIVESSIACHTTMPMTIDQDEEKYCEESKALHTYPLVIVIGMIVRALLLHVVSITLDI